jgi:hypothetical protein
MQMQTRISEFGIDSKTLVNRGAQNVDDMVRVDDLLRSQSTTTYKKGPSMRPYDFPNLYIDGPIVVNTMDPRSTRSDIQNMLFESRYFNK